jgi:hypothetical protein
MSHDTFRHVFDGPVALWIAHARCIRLSADMLS